LIFNIIIAIVIAVAHAIVTKPIEIMLETKMNIFVKAFGVIVTIGAVGLNLFMIVTNAAID
jgi:hypothetical protein